MNLMGIIGGAMAGGGAAAQVALRDEAIAEKRRQELEMEMHRREALERMRLQASKELNEQQHTQRRELQGIENESAERRLERQLGVQESIRTEDRELRREALEAQKEDRAAMREAQRAQLGLGYAQIKANKEIASERQGLIGKLPEADRMALASAQEQVKNADAALLKAQSDPMYDPKSPGVAELNTRLQEARARQQAILEKNGFAMPEAKPTATGTTSLVQPPAAAIADLRKDPKLAPAFAAKYGQSALDAALKTEAAPTSGGILGTVRDALPDVSSLAKPDSQRKGSPREVELTPSERAEQQRLDAIRMREEGNRARVQEMQAQIARIPQMSPSEAQALLDEYGTRLPGKARAQLNAVIRSGR